MSFVSTQSAHISSCTHEHQQGKILYFFVSSAFWVRLPLVSGSVDQNRYLVIIDLVILLNCKSSCTCNMPNFHEYCTCQPTQTPLSTGLRYQLQMRFELDVLTPSM
jgi:hypothetical protein